MQKMPLALAVTYHAGYAANFKLRIKLVEFHVFRTLSKLNIEVKNISGNDIIS